MGGVQEDAREGEVLERGPQGDDVEACRRQAGVGEVTVEQRQPQLPLTELDGRGVDVDARGRETQVQGDLDERTG